MPIKFTTRKKFFNEKKNSLMLNQRQKHPGSRACQMPAGQEASILLSLKRCRQNDTAGDTADP